MTTNSRRSFNRTGTASAITIVLLLVSCAGLSPVQADEQGEPRPERRPRPSTYHAAIREGRKAAQDVLQEGRASALTIALVGRGGVIWSQAFGFADREAGKPANPHTMFGIGSVSKLFATIAALKLVDKGLVDLDRPLIEYLPDFRMASPDYGKITIRMLLNHSSGFPGTDYRNGETTSPVPVVPRGGTTTVTIGPDGYAEWRGVAVDATPVGVDIATTGAWRIYDPAFKAVADGKGNFQTALSAASGLAYIILFGDPGQTITLTVSEEGSVR